MSWFDVRHILAALLLCVQGGAESKRVLVIAHRGEHLAHAENTISAFQAAVDAGADFIELDVRTTADGALVLMHDSDVARTTNGRGRVASMTLEEIRALQVKPNDRVPTFDEALAFAKGKIGVYVDSKSVSPAAVIAAIERQGMGEQVVIYGGVPYLKDVAARRPAWKVMPEAESAEHLKSLLESLPIKVVAFDARDFNDAAIAVARRAGTDIYVDRLGAADVVQYWQDAIDRGATGIQSDHPAELVAYLKSKGYR